MSIERKFAESPSDARRARAPRPTTAARSEAGTAGTVLGLQQTAGNTAVGQAVSAQQRRSQVAAQSVAANPSMTLQLGALWNDMVVMPLAHADEKLTREKPDEEGALADIDFALRGIGSVKNATSADDPNRTRIEILEMRVTGLRDLVQEARGKGKSRVQLERQMIQWRVEATTLGPELKYPPRRPEETDELSSTGAETTSPGAVAPNSAQVTGAGPASGAATSTAAAPAEESYTVPQLWRELVVDYLWKGQQEMDRSVSDARWWFLHAANNSGYFAYGTPVGDPNRMRQFRVFHGLALLADMVIARAGDPTGPLVDACETAYDHAATLGKRLTGQPVEEAEPAATTESAEPDFTWERETERPPFKNDTDLERP